MDHVLISLTPHDEGGVSWLCQCKEWATEKTQKKAVSRHRRHAKMAFRKKQGKYGK